MKSLLIWTEVVKCCGTPPAGRHVEPPALSDVFPCFSDFQLVRHGGHHQPEAGQRPRLLHHRSTAGEAFWEMSFLKSTWAGLSGLFSGEFMIFLRPTAFWIWSPQVSRGSSCRLPYLETFRSLSQWGEDPQV